MQQKELSGLLRLRLLARPSDLHSTRLTVRDDFKLDHVFLAA
jgi:hypothetical protein